ncbi:histone family protein [Paraburkholderia caribensis MBA4]|uniref:Histone family protein n=1 Tax=Paraburkholderia caribensis MBA4 TaxID=1323664 RepID=A0A0P0RID1_9BURK|nr:H-NS family nucleoid-associated regulatory protein [Paraburkholderia caribensis]ALL68264.1 histone family protein [Paraburkholderia caribensis MBA4]
MVTLERVQAQIAKLQERAEALKAKQSSSVIARIRSMMDEHGLSVSDIEAHVGRKERSRPAQKQVGSQVKYRDPKTGSTWTGHGRAPAWIASAKDRTRFLVEDGSAATIPGTGTGKRKGAYPRGPQAPKYHDPSTGATWSGRGPAPAWLAGVKDRGSYLIEKADANEAPAARDAGKQAVKQVAKKAAARKATAKKGASKKVAAKKSAGSKPVAAKKSAGSKPVAAKKSAAAEQVAVKKSAAPKKAAAKKSAASKKVAAKKSVEQTLAAGKTAGKTAAAKKAPVKKSTSSTSKGPAKAAAIEQAPESGGTTAHSPVTSTVETPQAEA